MHQVPRWDWPEQSTGNIRFVDAGEQVFDYLWSSSSSVLAGVLNHDRHRLASSRLASSPPPPGFGRSDENYFDCNIFTFTISEDRK